MTQADRLRAKLERSGFSWLQAAVMLPLLQDVEELKRNEDPDHYDKTHCEDCGSMDLREIEEHYHTGVVAPDGGKEMVYGKRTQCVYCGAYQE